ncbi:MAG: sigma-70 family RNA polymerase sigma factor [Planctomycetes bacterium]|nr:sigma-70 family RNA polymerase sigma factor [Planctomycetota bacterium]
MTAAALPALDDQPDRPDRTVAGFVRRHQAGLWRWLRTLGCEAADAEEHCQDALLAGLTAGADRWPPDDAGRWLRRAARNLFLMRLRRERRQPNWTSLDGIEAGWQAIRGDHDGGAAAVAALGRCLRALGEREAELVERRYRAGESRADMGRALGLGEAGIKQALRRVRDKLRTCVRRRLQAMDEETEA